MDVEERAFDGDRASVSAARRFVSTSLERHGLPELIDTAVLLTSELVANAVLHAASAPAVRVVVDGGFVSVEVLDGSPMLPQTKRYGPEAATGRGLQLVGARAADWGAERVGSGKRVWFRLDPTATGESTAIAATPRAADVPGGDVELEALAAAFGEPFDDRPPPGSGSSAGILVGAR